MNAGLKRIAILIGVALVAGASAYAVAPSEENDEQIYDNQRCVENCG